MNPAGARRVAVIGLDCAAPRFVFGEEAFDLPNLRALAHRGCWGTIRSCDPPITVPAWSVMTSGRDAGTLGVYGFQTRKNRSYTAGIPSSSRMVREPRIWDILTARSRPSIVVGVPQTYPPASINGCLVSGIMAPGPDSPYTYPLTLKQELSEALGEYRIDVREFRTEDKDRLLADLYDLTKNRFATARHLLSRHPWEFFMMVEMGIDRLHHGFWKYCDPEHPKFEEGNPYRDALKNYYEAVDAEIGDLVQGFDPDTTVIVISDHGAKALHGGFCINQWLANKGFLTLRERPAEPTRIEECNIDWSRTKAWSTGGYCGRIYLNVQGRDPEGAIRAEDYNTVRNAIIDGLKETVRPDGAVVSNTLLKPEENYEEVNGIAPDILAYFGDLHYRAIGKLGYSDVFTDENDTGPDDANHDFDGVFIMTGDAPRGEVRGFNLLDVAPTILDRLGEGPRKGMTGRVIS